MSESYTRKPKEKNPSETAFWADWALTHLNENNFLLKKYLKAKPDT